ncbi:hypothetical protein ACEWY4_020402 [Coilia grayii]|uniref:G-protein coupled receptors family 1 profile domain-containing protein n=1 Tax=Coilia grayii TaxID=363190 RepID=A0ABD1JCT3_9TELE
MNSTGNITRAVFPQLENSTIANFSSSSVSSYLSSSLTTVTVKPMTETTEPTIDYDYAAGIEPCSYPNHSATFLPVLYSLYFLMGMLGNALVVWVITKGVRLRSMTDVCLFNLSLADLLLVGSLPFLAHQAQDQWVFGDGMCKLVLGVYYVSYYGGIYFITLMGVDRYLAVVHAVYALRVRTRTYGILASIVVWVVAILSSFPEVLYLKMSNTNASALNACIRDEEKHDDRATAYFKMNVLGFVIPLAILLFCYTRILLTLLRSRSGKRQAVRLVVVVMVAFLCCWAPYNVTLFFWGLHNKGFFSDCESSKSLFLSLQITEVIAYTHCCLNPVLYVFVGEKFRRHLFKLLSKSPCVRSDFLKAYLTAASTGSVYSRTTSMEERSTAM